MAIILIVDDDPTARLIAGELLRSEGHATAEAADGDEALRIVASMAVDLVVLDMLMPNKDGLETIVELRRNYPGIRILAVSSGGRIGPGDLLRTAMMFGADECLRKPLRPDCFSRVVARVLAQPSSPAKCPMALRGGPGDSSPA